MGVLSKLFSKLAKEIEKAPIKKATGKQWENYLKNRGVKQEELQNFSDALHQKGNIPSDLQLTPEDALGYHRVLGDVPLDETLLSNDYRDYSRIMDNPGADELFTNYEPKYGSEHSLAGAPEENYKELVITTPWADDLARDSAHFTEVPGGSKNIAWLRFHNREHPDVGNLFHLDELQSKRHQMGQRKGYREDLSYLKEKANNLFKNNPIDPDNDWRLSTADRLTNSELSAREMYDEIERLINKNRELVPGAPFKGDNWKNLGLRRAVLEAANSNADAFSWTAGKMQEQRWSGNAGEGINRMYDKYIPNQLMKDLKEHGVTPQDFTSLPIEGIDPAELSPEMAHFMSRTGLTDVGAIPEVDSSKALLSLVEANPDHLFADLTGLGMPDDIAEEAIAHLSDIAGSVHKEDELLEAMSEWASQYSHNENNKRLAKSLPAIKLSPEVRKSILEKGFPKYMLPFGLGAGSLEDMQMPEQLSPEEIQQYSSGGLVTSESDAGGIDRFEPMTAEGYVTGGLINKAVKTFRNAIKDDQLIEHFTFGDKITTDEELLKRMIKGNGHSVDPNEINAEGVKNAYYNYLKSGVGDQPFNIHNHMDEVAPSTSDLDYIGNLSINFPELLETDNLITSSYLGQPKLSNTKKLSNSNKWEDYLLEQAAKDDTLLDNIVAQTTYPRKSIIDDYLLSTLKNKDEAATYSNAIKSSKDFPSLLMGKHLKDKGLYSIEYPEYKIFRDNDKELLDDMADQLYPKIKFAAGGLVEEPTLSKEEMQQYGAKDSIPEEAPSIELSKKTKPDHHSENEQHLSDMKDSVKDEDVKALLDEMDADDLDKVEAQKNKIQILQTHAILEALKEVTDSVKDLKKTISKPKKVVYNEAGEVVGVR